MKKIGFVLVALAFVKGGFSQDVDTKVKNFRFGLKVAPSINWLKPQDTRKFENAGSALSFNWGLITEFRMGELFSFSTGLELNHEAGKIGFLNPTYYAITDDYEFIETEKNDATGDYQLSDTSKPYAAMQLNERKYSSTYVTLPIAVKMKTKEIGYMTYFGEFGLNAAFRTNTKVSDVANPLANPSNIDVSDLSKIIYDKDMQPLRLQLLVGFGTEYNIAGSTSLVGSIHYNLGFTNVVDKNSKFLLDDDSQRVGQNFSAHGIRLTIGVLF